MALFNYATKEITLKLVYYGPGLSGKTTNLHYLHSILEPERRGKLLALSTETDRTLFFDFLPVSLGKIREFSIRFQLYTVPGQVRYDATRRLVLKGADAVVFVADSQKEMRDQNIESFENMRTNLRANNIDPDTIPVLLQFNKRDLPNLLSIDEINQDLNDHDYRYVLAEAINGTGVMESFKLITDLLLKDISKRHNVQIDSMPDLDKEFSTPVAAAPEAPPPPPPPIEKIEEAPLVAELEPETEEVSLDEEIEGLDIIEEDEEAPYAGGEVSLVENAGPLEKELVEEAEFADDASISEEFEIERSPAYDNELDISDTQGLDEELDLGGTLETEDEFDLEKSAEVEDGLDLDEAEEIDIDSELESPYAYEETRDIESDLDIVETSHEIHLDDESLVTEEILEEPVAETHEPEAIRKISREMKELAESASTIDVNRLKRQGDFEEGETPYSAEKVEIMFNSLIELTGSISGSVSDLSGHVKDLKTDVATLYSLKSAFNDMLKDFQEIKKQQAEIISILKDMHGSETPTSSLSTTKPAAAQKKKGIFGSLKK